MQRPGGLQLTKYAPPPSELPIYQRVDPSGISFFGRTNYEAALEEKKFIFGIKRADRDQHIYIVGKSGMGKTKLLELLIRQDIAYGHGCCLIDPYGDLIDAVLDFIPKERANDVVLVDLSDIARPVAFNPLAGVRMELKHQAVQGFIEVMERQFGANWTPRLEHILRFAVLALLDYPSATIRGMISLLTDEEYRRKVIPHITDELAKHFWEVEFSEWSRKFDAEAIAPLVNKLSRFFSNPMLRGIFSGSENKVDIARIIEEQKILLVNLSRGKLGEEDASFFGSMFIMKLYQASMERAKIPERDRKDFYVYIDEFHNLATKTFEHLFFESRKYGICNTISHQFVSQLSEHMRITILGNTGTIVVFRASGEDAALLEKEMTPIFRARDMINLGRQEFYIKMTIDGDTYDPFSAELLKVLPVVHPSRRELIVQESRRKYARAI